MVTRAQAAYQKWYKLNKVEHNRKRRRRYAEDAEERRKVLGKQKESRDSKPRTRKTEPKKREGVFRIGEVADRIGRDEQVIRKWEKSGYIPPPSIQGYQRLYNEHQVQLLMEFREVMDQVRYAPKVRQETIAEKTSELFSRWKSAR